MVYAKVELEKEELWIRSLFGTEYQEIGTRSYSKGNRNEEKQCKCIFLSQLACGQLEPDITRAF